MNTRKRPALALAALTFPLLLAGCGGGGGSTTTTTTPTPSVQTKPTTLVINEVGAGWLELHNISASAVGLKDYQMRSASWLLVGTEWKTYAEYKWDLPDVAIPANGYVFIRRAERDKQQQPKVYPANSKWVELGETGRLFSLSPDNGFVDLIRNGQSADFIRWGKSKVEPTTSIGTATTLAIPSLGALIRSESGALETRNFPTPGGPNDVPDGAADVDQDGIPDTAEVPGGHMAGLDLYAMGARSGARDIFVEVDAMTSSDPGIDVTLDSYNKVIAAFAKKGFVLHIDRGDRFSTTFDPQRLNLGNDSAALSYSRQVFLGGEDGETVEGNLRVYKHQNFDPRRLNIFHYAVMGSKMSDAVGRGELFGNDFIVGREGYSSFFGAKTFMHELGHNLNLQHGGFEELDKKPNYPSVMNARYNCLIFRPEDKDCRLDYSDGTSQDLNEEHLDERVGWGRAPFFADWNKDGLVQNDLKFDINGDGNYQVFKDYNDWANLKLDFAQQTARGGVGYLSLPKELRDIPSILVDDEQAFED